MVKGQKKAKVDRPLTHQPIRISHIYIQISQSSLVLTQWLIYMWVGPNWLITQDIKTPFLSAIRPLFFTSPPRPLGGSSVCACVCNCVYPLPSARPGLRKLGTLNTLTQSSGHSTNPHGNRSCGCEWPHPGRREWKQGLTFFFFFQPTRSIFNRSSMDWTWWCL